MSDFGQADLHVHGVWRGVHHLLLLLLQAFSHCLDGFCPFFPEGGAGNREIASNTQPFSYPQKSTFKWEFSSGPVASQLHVWTSCWLLKRHMTFPHVNTIFYSAGRCLGARVCVCVRLSCLSSGVSTWKVRSMTVVHCRQRMMNVLGLGRSVFISWHSVHSRGRSEGNGEKGRWLGQQRKEKDPHAQTFLWTATRQGWKRQVLWETRKTLNNCCFVTCIISLLITFTLIL